jgi:hypothetical protein
MQKKVIYIYMNISKGYANVVSIYIYTYTPTRRSPMTCMRFGTGGHVA